MSGDGAVAFVMQRYWWALGTVLFGNAVAATAVLSLWHLAPTAGLLDHWPSWWAVLTGPYVVAAASCVVPPGDRYTSNVLRLLAFLISLGGAAILAAMLHDFWTARQFTWFRPTNYYSMSLTRHAGAVVLLAQYCVAAAAVLVRLTSR